MLSMILAAYNMSREVPRTLYTLSRPYQLGIDDVEYEVIVVENGSTDRLSERMVHSLGPEFRYIYFNERNPSPVRAVNHAVSRCRGDVICIMNDGARMLSPGIIKYAIAAFRAFRNPVVTPLSWHLGSEMQMESVQKGYCPEVEDKLLETVPWRNNGYALFDISVLSGSSKDGWFRPISESNCLFMKARVLSESLGGLDERFVSSGGGLIALDFFRNAWLLEDIEPVILLGEGTFHQVHGGIATNAPEGERKQRFDRMFAEYKSIRGTAYEPPNREPIYLGTLPPQSRRFVKFSVDNLP